MTAVTEEHLLVNGLGFPEEPRWRDGALWFIDIWRKAVIGVDQAGAPAGRYDLGFRPGGIGWLPDGDLVVADVEANRVVAIQPRTGAMRTHADLSARMRVRTNGLCAASDGTLYVTSTGSDLQDGQERASGNIIRVAPDGTATVICDEELMFPNGVALIADEKCLLIAETFGERVTILDLGTGRQHAVTAPGTYPDGICAAPGDTFWFADARGKRCLQGTLDGQITQERHFTRLCYAPAVDPDGSRLYTTAADGFDTTSSARGNAAVIWTPLTPQKSDLDESLGGEQITRITPSGSSPPPLPSGVRRVAIVKQPAAAARPGSQSCAVPKLAHRR